MSNAKSVDTAPSAQASYEDEWYDLLPIEKKLVGYTLGLGLTLLVIFVVVFKVL